MPTILYLESTHSYLGTWIQEGSIYDTYLLCNRVLHIGSSSTFLSLPTPSASFCEVKEGPSVEFGVSAHAETELQEGGHEIAEGRAPDPLHVEGQLN